MPRIVPLLWQALGSVFERRDLALLAQSCYQKAIDSASQGDAGSRFRLARLMLLEKKYVEALPLLEHAISVDPDGAEYWNALGIVRRECNDMPGAGDAFKHALAANPALIPAQSNYGNWLLANGEPGQGLAWFDKALSRNENFYEALNNRVVALLDLGRSTDAEKSAMKALEQFPQSAPLHLNLGNSYLQQGKAFLALKAYKRALELEPHFEEAHFNHALLEGSAEHLSQAINFLRKQIEVRGRTVDLLSRLAVAYTAKEAYVAAEAVCREILQKDPGFAPAHVSLGIVLSRLGLSNEALDAYAKALELRPDDASVHSNYLFELNYSSSCSSRFLFEKHVEWAAKHDHPVSHVIPSAVRNKDKNRRLRVGYVSPDLFSHPVGYLIKGVLQQHDKNSFDVYCYARVAKPDRITEECKKSVTYWHDTVGLNDEEVTRKVVEDEIDILVDLSGHTGAHRLGVFSGKSAPVQAAWIGYFHSTGMSSIDYFITDPYTSPKSGDQLFSETPVWLPHTRFCYSPPAYAPPVAEPPCLKKGYVTFGCFNKLNKMTVEVVHAWSQILLRLPSAHLLLKNAALMEPSVCDRVLAQFAAYGIEANRIILRNPSPHAEMLNEYAEVDIALDPFPYNGGMTTFEALLMGVPVVTLALQNVVARQSASALTNLGLTDLIHDTVIDYIDGSVALASDTELLSALRSSIRPTMAGSPLCDVRTFTGDLEKLYRRMWHAWCDGTRLPSDLESPLNGDER